MSFTEIFGFAGGEPDKQAEPVRLPWLGPPDDELGVAIAEGVVVARSERGAVGLSHLVVHSSGAVCFSSSSRSRAV
jgi:hypothetical protein